LEAWNCGKTCSSHPEVSEVELLINKTGDVSGFLAYNNKLNSIMIVFRGTVPWDIKNWIEDLNFIYTSYANCDNGCKVHEGFYGDFKEVQSDMMKKLNSKIKNHPDSQIIVTGHSLGAAIATLAASELISKGIQVDHLYTFGSPRVGDSNYVSWFESKFNTNNVFRITHHMDPVPHLPPLDFTFLHLPYEVFYNLENSSYQICDGSGEDKNCSDKYIADLLVTDHITYMKYDFAALIVTCQV